MVRLKENPKGNRKVGQTHFNSTMVRLKEIRSHEKDRTAADFNSTMVRLKGTTEARMTYLLQFQFHYGTIKSIQCNATQQRTEYISIPLWYD